LQPFEPASWVANGVRQARVARTDDTWEARWNVQGVISRLTMLGAPGTEVNSLQTYPMDQAVITKDHPACQTLCVRRHGDSSFLAVGDAWRSSPNLKKIARGDVPNSLRLTTASNTYYLLLADGQVRFDDGVALQTDAAAVVLRNRDAVLMIGGHSLEMTSPHGRLKITLDPPGSLAAEFAKGSLTFETGDHLQYETLAGENVSLQKTNRTVEFTGDLWKIRSRHERRTR
jgi:hypothetical protein